MNNNCSEFGQAQPHLVIYMSIILLMEHLFATDYDNIPFTVSLTFLLVVYF